MKGEEMQSLRKAAQQALDFFERKFFRDEFIEELEQSIIALRAALNQERYVVTGNEFHGAPPEPYANWGDAIATMIDRGVIQGLRISALAEDRSDDTGKTSDHIADADKMVATIRPDVTVEPVAWSYTDARGRTVVVIANTAPYEDAKPLYSAPPKRKPLTEEELSDVVSNETRGHLDRDTYTYALVCMIARALERAHGIGGEE